MPLMEIQEDSKENMSETIDYPDFEELKEEEYVKLKV